jgi:hypothetical protein
MAAAEAAEAGALGEHVGGVVGEQRHDRVEHGDFDVLPFAGALAGEERARDPVGRIDARVDVRHRRGGFDRRAVLFSGMRHDAPGRLDDEIHAGVLRHRPALAEGGDRAVDEARIDCAQVVVAEALAVHHAGAEVLDEHVRVAHQAADQLDTGRLADVDTDAALVAVQPLEVEPADLRRQAPGAIGVADAVAAPGLLDLDDVRAHVAE